jgi:colicin import membrane protein
MPCTIRIKIMDHPRHFSLKETRPRRSHAWLAAVGFHGFLLVCGMGWFWQSHDRYRALTPQSRVASQTIQATAVSSKQLQHEVALLQVKAAQKKRAERKRIANIQKQTAALQALKRAQQQARHRLAQLKKAKAQQLKALQAAQVKQNQLRMVQAKAKAQAKARAQAKALAKAKRQAQAREKRQRLAEQKALNQRLLAQQLAADQKVLQAQAQAARQRQGIIDRYKAQIITKISQNWFLPHDANPQASCRFLVDVGPGGIVLQARLLRSSGNAVLDRSAKTAILKASPLPVPKDPALFASFRSLRLTVRPQGLINT